VFELRKNLVSNGRGLLDRTKFTHGCRQEFVGLPSLPVAGDTEYDDT
jgi:hypothetical protein